MKRPECAKSRATPIGIAGGSWLRRAAAGLAVAAAVAGCGKAEDSLPRHAVYGKVTLDDKPLEKGTITFTPEAQAANPVTGGGVISAGSYSIPVDKGLTPGKYKVSIAAAADGPALAAGEAPGAPPKAKAKAEPAIPAKYNAQSTLEAEVKPGQTSFDFKLSSK